MYQNTNYKSVGLLTYRIVIVTIAGLRNIPLGWLHFFANMSVGLKIITAHIQVGKYNKIIRAVLKTVNIKM